MNNETLRLIEPDTEVIASDDYLFEPFIGGDDPQGRIFVHVFRGDLDNELQYTFAVPPEQAVALAHELLTLAYRVGAEIAE